MTYRPEGRNEGIEKNMEATMRGLELLQRHGIRPDISASMLKVQIAAADLGCQ